LQYLIDEQNGEGAWVSVNPAIENGLAALGGPPGTVIGGCNLVRQGGGDEGEHKSNKGKH